MVLLSSPGYTGSVHQTCTAPATPGLLTRILSKVLVELYHIYCFRTLRVLWYFLQTEIPASKSIAKQIIKRWNLLYFLVYKCE